MPPSVLNYRPQYGSMMTFSTQTPPHSSTMMHNDNVQYVGASEFLEFSTQMSIGGTWGVNEATPHAEDSAHIRRKSPKWSTEQNFVLLTGWIKYGTDSIVGINKKSESH